jgi:hypothetical protein
VDGHCPTFERGIHAQVATDQLSEQDQQSGTRALYRPHHALRRHEQLDAGRRATHDTTDDELPEESGPLLPLGRASRIRSIRA